MRPDIDLIIKKLEGRHDTPMSKASFLGYVGVRDEDLNALLGHIEEQNKYIKESLTMIALLCKKNGGEIRITAHDLETFKGFIERKEDTRNFSIVYRYVDR